MNRSPEAEVTPKLFGCFVKREQTGLPSNLLPKAIGALPAGEGLLRAAGHLPGAGWPEGWYKVPSSDCFHRNCEKTRHILEVYKIGAHWFILRINGLRAENLESLALAFGHVPICAYTCEEGMRLADHCHPNPGQTIAGCWVQAVMTN